MMYNDNNIFAKILRGEIPASFIAESEHAVAFNDIAPKARVHKLVIPRGAYTDIADFIARASEAEQLDFWRLARRIAVDAGVVDGFRTQANTGASAGQEVPHFHIHILAN